MPRRIDIEFDREFQLHTSYHNDFFLLRTKILVDGKSTEIRSVSEEGRYDGPSLKVCRFGSTSSTKLWRIENAISPILHRCGVYHVDTFYYEQSPLFHTVFTSESCLRKFLLAMGEVKSAMETQLHYLLSRNLKSIQCHVPEAGSPQQLTIEVQPELFLVSPNQQKTKGADLHLITIENCSDHLTHWKSSKLFEFSSLYQEEGLAVPPKITTHPKELMGIFPGKTASFTVQATGTEPLKYQWQWKPDGEKKGSEEWQNICDGSTFQQVEAGGLKLTDLQACNAGHYRCVVSNSAGSATSQFANLVIAVPPKITTHPKELMGIFPGKTASFTVQATGMEPLKYQWQWKPDGEKKGSEEWQNISCDGSTFQQVEAGELKLTDLQACNAGHYRCVVSNSAGSATSQFANLVIAAELLDLVNELQEVNNWIPFGLNLGIDISRLEAIEKERATIEERRTQLFIYWQKQVVPTWSAVVKALINIGMRRLAMKVAQKYGVPVPEWSDDETLEQLANLSQQGETSATRSELLAEVQKHSVDIRKVDVEIIDTKKRLEQSQKSKASIDQNVNQILCSISELQRKVESIAHERNITKDKLESKQQERQLLSEMQDVVTESMQGRQKQHRFWKKDQEKERQLQEKKVTYRTLLERIITKKGKKIEKLEEELQHKDSELRSAQQEARSLDEKLSQARAEIKMKHEEVKQLQKEKEELTCSYNIEKEKVSKLVQIAATLTADKEKIEQLLMSTKDESELKSQHIEACNSSITSLSEKVETLSCTLKEKEATAAQLQGELQSSYHLVSSTTEQLLELLKLQPQIVELERKLQEAEYKHQQAVLEKRAVVQEMEARKKLEVRLCAQLDLTTRVKTEESETRLHNELRTPLKLRWEKRSNILYGMTYPKTVQLHNNLYVGGGQSYSDQYTVLKYDQSNDTWSKLLQYDCRLFGMSAINGYLTVVGGQDIATHRASNKVGVWKPSSQRWTQPYPPMITPRYCPEVATYNNYLLAAGGRDDGGSPLTTVEVLDVRDGRQWLTVSQLLVPCAYKTSAIIQDNWYVITDGKEVMYTHLPTLCQTASKSAATSTPVQWQRLPNTPLGDTTAIALSGSLLTVGGRHGNTVSTAIHLYHPETNTWSEVGNLPTRRYCCSATVLASGELLVSGGQDQQGKRTTLVDIATI